MSADGLERDGILEGDVDYPITNEKEVEWGGGKYHATSIAQPGDLEGQDGNLRAGPLAASSFHGAVDEMQVVYPEGGVRAWLVVFGSFCGMLSSFGFMNSRMFPTPFFSKLNVVRSTKHTRDILIFF